MPKGAWLESNMWKYVQFGAIKTELFVIRSADYKCDSNLAQRSTARTQERWNLGLILP